MSNKPDWSEFDQFLKPISKDSPAGSSLQYDATYDEIREARRHEDTRLPQGVWQRDLKVADWSKSTKICTDALINKSKDLQVAAWLAESWLHEKGIRGLLSGIRLMHALCDQFWGTLHPLIDEDGADHRLAPIDWLNEKLPEQLTLYAISNPELGNVPYYSLAEYEYLQSHGDKSSSVKALPDPKEMTQAALQTSIKDTPNYFYEVLYNDCLKTIGALEDFESFLSDKVSSDAVSLYQLRASLGKFRDCMLSVLRERDLLGVDVKTLELEVCEEPESLAMNDEKQLPTNQPLINLSANSQLASREQAYAMLAEIAQYLQAIEPHSPTPYLLKKAITWGNMPLSSLLQEFIQNNMDFAQLQRWLGIPNTLQKKEEPPVAQQG